MVKGENGKAVEMCKKMGRGERSIVQPFSTGQPPISPHQPGDPDRTRKDPPRLLR